MKKYLAGLSVFVVSVLLVGCGGGDESSSGTNNTPVVSVIDTAIYSSSNKLLIGSNFNYKIPDSCIPGGGLFEIKADIYNNSTVMTYNSKFSGEKINNLYCGIEELYKKLQPIDGDTNATFITRSFDNAIFFDNTTKIFYEVQGNIQQATRLIRVTNNGLTGITVNNDNFTETSSVLKEVYINIKDTQPTLTGTSLLVVDSNTSDTNLTENNTTAEGNQSAIVLP